MLRAVLERGWRRAMGVLQEPHRIIPMLHVDQLKMPSCNMGQDDPLPALRRLRHGRAWLKGFELEDVRALLDESIVPANIAEGETLLSDLWFAYKEREREQQSGRTLSARERQAVRDGNPPPPFLDFRQSLKEV